MILIVTPIRGGFPKGAATLGAYTLVGSSPLYTPIHSPSTRLYTPPLHSYTLPLDTVNVHCKMYVVVFVGSYPLQYNMYSTHINTGWVIVQTYTEIVGPYYCTQCTQCTQCIAGHWTHVRYIQMQNVLVSQIQRQVYIQPNVTVVGLNSGEETGVIWCHLAYGWTGIWTGGMGGWVGEVAFER